MLLHHVVQGDHLARIAAQHGFARLETIWDHPANAELRRLRDSPHQLVPGDVVAIPEREVGDATCPTGQRHVFVCQRSPLRLRLRVLDFTRAPLSGVGGLLAFGEAVDVTTDGDGLLELALDPAAELGALTLPQGRVDLRIGHLDPVDEETGLRARLSNLGYLIGAIEAADEVEELRFALQEFQADHDLPCTGQPDAATLSALRDAHGC